jgi:hypothetical protein
MACQGRAWAVTVRPALAPPGGMRSCRVEAGSLRPQAVQGSVSVSGLKTLPADQVVPELVGDCCRACRAHFIELSTGPMRNVWRTDTGPNPGYALQPAQPGGFFRSPGDGAQRRWQAELREAALAPASAASGRTPTPGIISCAKAVILPTATLQRPRPWRTPPSPPANARPSRPKSGRRNYLVAIGDMLVAGGTGRTCRSLPGAGRNGAILKRPGTGIHAKPQRQGMDIRPRTTGPSFFVREDATLPLGLSSDAAAPAPGSGTVLDKARRHGGDSEKRLAGRPLRSRHGRTLAR